MQRAAMASSTTRDSFCTGMGKKVINRINQAPFKARLLEKSWVCEALPRRAQPIHIAVISLCTSYRCRHVPTTTHRADRHKRPAAFFIIRDFS